MGTTVLLHQESLDFWQEKLALASERPGYFQRIGDIGNPLVYVAPGFSVYDDGTMCPVGQVLNLRRSLLAAARANAAGLPTVPTIGWCRDRPSDITFIAGWLRRQGDKVTTIAVNAQTARRNMSLTMSLGQGMLEIESQANSKYRWLVFGGRKRIGLLAQLLPRERMVQIARPIDFHQV